MREDIASERAYQALWKFYVFAGTRDPAELQCIQEVALAEFSAEFPGARNVYRV